MNTTDFVKALRSGKHLFGTLIVSPAPKWPGVVATLGLDFVFIDTEHIALDRSQVSQMCNSYQNLGLLPVVRIPSPDPYAAAMMLDGGACGIVAPYVETADQVRQLVGAVKYRPLKGEKLQEILAKRQTIEPELLKYLNERNSGNACIVNIESVPALESLDKILEVEGLDAVLIGPHDLSCSMGLPERYDDPKFHKAVEEIIKRARARNIGAGIHVTYPSGFEKEKQWAQTGANLIIHSADIIAFQTTMRYEIDAIKTALIKGDARQSLEDINI
jgi:4-hydroxy-2-oxoheptanedioate aldolase